MPQEHPPFSKNIIDAYRGLLRQPIVAPEVAPALVSTAVPASDTARPSALILSPHPDDECLTGVLPLRLKQEQNWQIINVAVTLGSNLDRRAGRRAELAKACAVLGFDCVLPEADGFADINAAMRSADPVAWHQKVGRLSELIMQTRPNAIFMPHSADWNATHIGVHLLGMDALAEMPPDFACEIILSEYWQPMENPNVMIGVSDSDAATLLSALACHVGEVARNPYDRRFPAYLIDNVRRGSERLGGKGAEAAPMDMAEMYRMGLWLKGKFVPSALHRFVSAEEKIKALLG